VLRRWLLVDLKINYFGQFGRMLNVYYFVIALKSGLEELGQHGPPLLYELFVVTLMDAHSKNLFINYQLRQKNIVNFHKNIKK